MVGNYNNRTRQGPPVLLNVAEKPSVARALVSNTNTNICYRKCSFVIILTYLYKFD